MDLYDEFQHNVYFNENQQQEIQKKEKEVTELETKNNQLHETNSLMEIQMKKYKQESDINLLSDEEYCKHFSNTFDAIF